MKSLILTLALAVAPGQNAIPDQAPDPAPSRDGSLMREQCLAYKEGAAAVMRGRQEGIPLNRMLDELDNLNMNSQAQRDMWNYLVLAAYKIPRYRQQATADEAIKQFAQHVQIKCLEAVQEAQ